MHVYQKVLESCQFFNHDLYMHAQLFYTINVLQNPPVRPVNFVCWLLFRNALIYPAFV
jgi:hypothetical protein